MKEGIQELGADDVREGMTTTGNQQPQTQEPTPKQAHRIMSRAGAGTGRSGDGGEVE